MSWFAAIPAIASVAGSLLDAKSGSDSRQFQEEQAARNEAMQREFAQNGIRWKVADAKAAGVHPLFALGSQPFNPSPSQVFPQETNFSEAFGRAGQDISRAIDSTRTQDERDEARLSALRVENASLQNDLLRSQIARLNREQVGPPMVDPANPGVRLFGTADARIEESPLKRMAAAEGSPHLEAGSVTDMGFARTPTGYAIVPSKDWKDRGEDQFFPEVTWAIRNHLLPSISPSRYGYPPPETWLPEGASHWSFDRLKQEWRPVFSARGQARVRYPISEGR